MKLASSIRFGGQLVDAADCGYQDYKALQLLCPACKQPVFLQGDSLRNLKDKTISIPAHFKHFPFVDPALVADCEARVAKYDQKEITKRAVIARNQRLKTFQKYFWKLFINNVRCLRSPSSNDLRPFEMEKDIFDFMSKNRTLIISESHFKNREDSDNFYKNYIQNYDFNKYLDDTKEGKANMKQRIYHTVIRPTDLARIKLKEYVSSKINLNFHIQILNEIVDFLYTHSSRQLRFACIVFGFFAKLRQEDKSWEWFKRQVIEGHSFAKVAECAFIDNLVEMDWAKILTHPDEYLEFNLNYSCDIAQGANFSKYKYESDESNWCCGWGDVDSDNVYTGNLKECIVFVENQIINTIFDLKTEENQKIQAKLEQVFETCQLVGAAQGEGWIIWHTDFKKQIDEFKWQELVMSY